MAGKLKLIGIVLVVLAASGVAATAAQAEGTFEAEEYPANLAGEQTEMFEFEVEGVGKVKCTTATFTGAMSGSSSTVGLAPSFSGCTAFGFAAATFNSNGCEFIVHGGEEISEVEFEAPMDISCGEAMAKLEFHIPATGCVLSIGGQVALGDLFIKLKFGLPPDLVIGMKVGQVTGALENTVGKKCFLGVGAVKLNVYGGLTLRAFNIGPYFGLGLA